MIATAVTTHKKGVYYSATYALRNAAAGAAAASFIMVVASL
jgi:hypothetical protein